MIRAASTPCPTYFPELRGEAGSPFESGHGDYPDGDGYTLVHPGKLGEQRGRP